MNELILSIAKMVGVPAQLLLAICTHESGLTNIYVKNDGGSPSIGVCQVKYETAKFLGFKGKEKDLMVPKTNILYAAKYIKYQKERYKTMDWAKLAASFNAGSYIPSLKHKGCPVNKEYLKLVGNKLPKELKIKLKCGEKNAF